MKFQIFISSVQREFAKERVQIAEYIRTDALLGVFFDPFLFEECAAGDVSPQRVYLNEVADTDIYLGLFGLRYGSRDDDGVSPTEREYAAVLLFGKDPHRHFLSAETKCAQFWGEEVAKPLPSYRIFTGSLIEQIESAVDFVLSRINNWVGSRVGGTSAEVPTEFELPEDAVKEAIVNAICHRDYLDNGGVQVMLFKNRLEILNPGSLPRGWTVKNLVEGHKSKPRNESIALALHMAGYVEKAGTGTLDIVAKCKAKSLKAPMYHSEGDDFAVTIWRAQSKGAVGAQSFRDRCIHLLSDAELGNRDIAERLGVATRSGYLRRMLSELMDDDLIERTIPDKPNSRLQTYRLTTKGTKLLTNLTVNPKRRK